MQLPWLRRDFVARRRLDRIFLDLPEAAIRALTGRRHWPPYSLRAYVGGAKDFGRAGSFFLGELQSLRILTPGAHFLEIGCGCGRIALVLAADPQVQELGISHVGMDVDRANIEWCQRHITPVNRRFEFYHADLQNPSYNPQGAVRASEYRFPHADASFDLILLTSVLTHILEEDLRHYLDEVARMLVPGGVVYATVFLYRSPDQLAVAAPRWGIKFPVVRWHYALNRADRPTNAVAYEESFIRELIARTGLLVIEPPLHGRQDLLLLTKRREPPLEVTLGDGWHSLEKHCWRWTERCFTVNLRIPGSRPRTLRFSFRLPATVLDQLGPIRLKAFIDGVALPECEYSVAGEHLYEQALLTGLGPTGLGPQEITVRFELNKALAPTSQDSRELGVQVAFYGFCAASRRELDPIRLE